MNPNAVGDAGDKMQELGKGCMGIGCMIPLIIILGSFLFFVIGGIFGSL